MMLSPLLIHVPHASVAIPPFFQRELLLDDVDAELLKMTDRYCDELFAAAAEMICFPVSRLICDPERFREDKQEEMAEKAWAPFIPVAPTVLRCGLWIMTAGRRS